jgi:hypothetical protein
MKLTQNEKYGLIAIGLVILWANRQLFMPKKKVNVKPNDGEDAISDALSKIKNGSIKVGEMPEDIRKEIMNEG